MIASSDSSPSADNGRFSFSPPLVLVAVIALVLVAATIGLGVRLLRETAALRQNIALAEQQLNFTQRAFFDVQREIFLTVSQLQRETPDVQAVDRHRAILERDIRRLLLPLTMGLASVDTQEDIRAIPIVWEEDTEPLFNAYLDNPQNQQLRLRLIEQLIALDPLLEQTGLEYELDRKASAGQLAENSNLLLSELRLILLVLYGIGGGILLFSSGSTIYLWRANRQRERARRELAVLNQELEQRVKVRTRDLEIASEVSRKITTVLNLDQLLPRLVRRTQQAFDLYYSSVFLHESDKRRLVLAAGLDASGGQPVAAGLAFPLDKRPSLVAKAGRDRRPIVSNNTDQSEMHAAQDGLPHTRSELVLPMLVGDELIGVMSLQSTHKNRFAPADVDILTTLAEQIAVAVKNARLYEAQIQLAEELRIANETKTNFLASMSHELRTPLNGIINFTEMLVLGMMGSVNEKQKELLTHTLNSSKDLLNLINDLLDISKIQAGRLALFVEDDVDLSAEAQTAVRTVQPLLKDKPVTIVQEIEQNLPLISADRRRIRQIFLNLLSNAAKFTDEGHIRLQIERDNGRVLCRVQDTGPGISADMHETIFQPFEQTDTGKKKQDSTGLGLPITKSLAEAHGGRIWVESEVGTGSTFLVSLPLEAAASTIGETHD